MYRHVSKTLMGGVFLLSAIMAQPTAALAVDPEVARTVLEEEESSIITIETTVQVKMNYQGQQQERENKAESVGVIVDDSGLAVTALSNIDPSKNYGMYMENEDDVSISIQSARYILADGTEIEAALVLRDPDLDLAFLRPKEAPEDPMNFVDFADSGEAEIFDDIFSIDRAGRIARRSALGKEGDIVGIIERPRKVYLPSYGVVTTGVGKPIFNDEGNILGLTSLYSFPGGKSALGNQDDPFIAVIIPAEDIIEVMAQAPKEVPE